MPPDHCTEILSAENLYKQSKFSQRIETTQLIKAFHPLRCFYLLGLILLYSRVGLRRSFAGKIIPTDELRPTDKNIRWRFLFFYND
jgi:hypothetical protein